MNGVGVSVAASPSAVVDHNTIADNARGVLLEGSSGSLVTWNHVVSSATVGITVVRSASAELHSNDIHGNVEYGAANVDSGLINAELNYWGATTGPRQPSNDSAKGDKVTEGFDTSPSSTEQFHGAGP